MDRSRARPNAYVWFLVWLGVMILGLVADQWTQSWVRLPSGQSVVMLISMVAGILAAMNLLTILTNLRFRRANKPAVEGQMVSSIYRLVAVVAVAMSLAYAFGSLGAFANFFTLFGGMLLGWSLQAPVSGFAAWLLISLKRPFRPQDRVQLPSLGLTGDVHEIGPMYTKLNQVGGTIGSEEAVGRYILVPNAMLFSQVVINYTVTQEAAYMLDEVVIRVTHDSDWTVAERILLSAANDVTEDIIKATGMQPYIRSDLYDYGVYLRLRFQTRVPERAKIAYEITKRIFDSFQNETSVDFAIPYVYSYRAGHEHKKGGSAKDREFQSVREIDIAHIEPSRMPTFDTHDVELLIESIGSRGLLQPVMLVKNPGRETYDILAGHLRFEACKRLGWQTVPAIVRNEGQAGSDVSVPGA